jgi:hypothetical protein
MHRGAPVKVAASLGAKSRISVPSRVAGTKAEVEADVALPLFGRRDDPSTVPLLIMAAKKHLRRPRCFPTPSKCSPEPEAFGMTVVPGSSQSGERCYSSFTPTLRTSESG